MEEFERMRNEATSKLDQEKQKLRDSEVEVEKIREDLVQQKWKLVRERKHYDEERKQLARLLLGMGEKISTNGIGNQAEDVLGDDSGLDLSGLQRAPRYVKVKPGRPLLVHARRDAASSKPQLIHFLRRVHLLTRLLSLPLSLLPHPQQCTTGRLGRPSS